MDNALLFVGWDFFKNQQLAFVHDGEAEGLLGSLTCGGDVKGPVAGEAVAMHLQTDTFGLHCLDVLTDRLIFAFLGCLRGL